MRSWTAGYWEGALTGLIFGCYITWILIHVSAH